MVSQVASAKDFAISGKPSLSELGRRNAIRLKWHKERRSSSLRAMPALVSFVPDMLRTEIHDLAAIDVGKQRSRSDIALVGSWGSHDKL